MPLIFVQNSWYNLSAENFSKTAWRLILYILNVKINVLKQDNKIKLLIFAVSTEKNSDLRKKVLNIKALGSNQN